MNQFGKRPFKQLLQHFGYEIARTSPPWPNDFRKDDIQLYREVAPYTMTTPEAIYALTESVRYINLNNIGGAIVECGVWRGGSMMAAAKTLLQLGRTDIDLYLFDTFEGMTEPTPRDVHWTGERAETLLDRERGTDESLVWARAGLEQVQRAMFSISYPRSKIHFVKGRVEDTLPDHAPTQVSVLRLDTDWYESSLHELVTLYPRVVVGGVLIIDDYGWWQGAGDATDEYFRENAPAPLLVRIDDSGCRLAVKT